MHTILTMESTNPLIFCTLCLQTLRKLHSAALTLSFKTASLRMRLKLSSLKPEPSCSMLLFSGLKSPTKLSGPWLFLKLHIYTTGRQIANLACLQRKSSLPPALTIMPFFMRIHGGVQFMSWIPPFAVVTRFPNGALVPVEDNIWEPPLITPVLLV